jgi:hypothetical protein
MDEPLTVIDPDLKFRLRISANDFIIKVLASPGTPSNRTCPRHKSDIKR